MNEINDNRIMDDKYSFFEANKIIGTFIKFILFNVCIPKIHKFFFAFYKIGLQSVSQFIQTVHSLFLPLLADCF